MTLLNIVSIPVITISTYIFGPTLFFYAIGISSTGPIASGLCASAQCTGLVARSAMSIIQSAAIAFR